MKPIAAKHIQLITKYRLSAHLIMSEKGRFTQTPRERRLCIFCHLNVEDEYHFILKCLFYYKYRTFYNRKYYWHIPSMYKLVQLMSTENLNELSNLELFLQRAKKHTEVHKKFLLNLSVL